MLLTQLRITKSFTAIQPMDLGRAADGLWASQKTYLYPFAFVLAIAFCNYVGVDEGRLCIPHNACTRMKAFVVDVGWTGEGNLYSKCTLRLEVVSKCGCFCVCVCVKFASVEVYMTRDLIIICWDLYNHIL